MTGNRTFSIIKPKAVRSGYIIPILSKIHEGGFKLIAMRFTQLTLNQAQDFYAVHKGKAFYEDLCEFMSSGPIIVLLLEKENAVEDYRKLIGATNPDEASENTVRSLYGSSVQENAVHGSDSDENAEIEGNFFFSATERF
ncbi:MAG: nucleoside-diphosphate kinase [Bacteroidales bacterium]|nr:nucleoside-diphosphate kinase [Bacteroidales bacterium]